jgi:hypothetical protein
MKRTFISLAVGFLVAALVYLALPATMYVEKAFNILAAAFIGSAVLTSLVLGLWSRHR